MRTEGSVEIDRPIDEVFRLTNEHVAQWSIVVVEEAVLVLRGAPWSHGRLRSRTDAELEKSLLMAGRVIAIGDVHGCSVALDSLLQLIGPSESDTIVTLGDYVNRGRDSRGVIAQLIDLRSRCRLVPLLGNHDELLLHNQATRTLLPGMPSVDPDNGLELFEDCHFAFLDTCITHHEIDTHFFVHANYDRKLPLEDQQRHVLLWLHLHAQMPGRHRSKKIAVVGHTSQRTGEVLNHAHLKCIDTFCHGGGWLTAMDVHSEELWQVGRDGVPRRPKI